MSKKILVIEDDNILQKAITTALETEGYNIVQAFDGKDGFDKIREEKPDLVILDLIMPVKLGEWVLEQMNETGIIDKYPLIVLTVKNDIATMDNCIRKLNVKNYLSKSDYTLEKIVEKVKTLIG